MFTPFIFVGNMLLWSFNGEPVDAWTLNYMVMYA